jgi:hypothetical protein
MGDAGTRATGFLVPGQGFGVPAYGARCYSLHEKVWTFLGFPTYVDGHFERWGLPTSVVPLLGFVIVCAAEVVVGVLLWRDATTAPWWALALLPVELLLWIGLALPLGPLLGLARTARWALLAVTARHPGRETSRRRGDGGTRWVPPCSTSPVRAELRCWRSLGNYWMSEKA